MNFLRFAAFTFLLSAYSLVAQTAPPSSGTSPSSSPRTRQAPCWEQAGITKSAFEQHQAIERDEHSQVSSVCSDSSMTPQQKMDRVKEIRQQAQQKNDEVITPDQQKAIAACRQQRGGGNAGGGMRHEGGNPCGGQWSRQGQHPNGSTGTPSGNSPNNSSSPQD